MERWLRCEITCKLFIYVPFSIHLFIGYEKIVQILIENGANVNAMNDENDTALLYAAAKGKISNAYIIFFKPLSVIRDVKIAKIKR